MKAFKIFSVFLLLFVLLVNFTQAQTIINRNDIPAATYFYIPIGDRSSSIQSDLRWDFRPGTNENPTQLFPGDYYDSNDNLYHGWYVATDFNTQYDYTSEWYNSSHDYHPGEDWNGNGGGNTELGEPVYATAAGRVIYKQISSSGFGNMVQLVHKLPSGEYVLSFYAHLDQVLVNVGDLVDLTTQIGTVGNSGTTYAHLHWEIRQQSFLDLSDQNTVSLKNSYPYTPTRWPGSDTQFITDNYHDPTDFIKKQDLIGFYADGQDGWHSTDTHPNDPSQPFIDCYNEVLDNLKQDNPNTTLTPIDNGGGIYAHTYPENGDPSSQDVLVLQDFEDQDHHIWHVVLNATRQKAFAVHGQIASYWWTDATYYGPPMGYEFQLPYSGGQYGNVGEQMVVQKFCKNQQGDYRKTIVYNTVSGSLGHYSVGVWNMNGNSGDQVYLRLGDGSYQAWPDEDNNNVPTGDWVIDAGNYTFALKNSNGEYYDHVTVEIWEGNHQSYDPDPASSSVSVPTNLTVQPVSTDEITFSWQDDVNPSGTDYKIYRDGQLINNGVPDKQYTDVNLSPGTTYDYQVSAVYDGAESGKSESLQAVTNSPNYYIQITYPNGGENFQRGDTVVVTYNYNIPGSRILFYYTFTGDPNDWFSLGSAEATGTYTWIPDDTPSEQYLIKILALDDNTINDVSDAYFSVTDDRPSPPSDIWVADIQASSARIEWEDEWNAAGSVDSYNVYRYDGANTVLAGSTTDLYFDDTGLQPSTGYHHWVKGVRNSHESDASNEVSFTTSSQDYLIISPDTLDFDSTQIQLNFEISSNISWTASASDSWISLSSNNGSSDATIELAVSRDNLSAGSHYGQVIVSGEGSNDTLLVKVVKVGQEQAGDSSSSQSSDTASFEPITFTDNFNRSSLGSSWLVDNYGGNGSAFIEDDKLKLNGPYDGNVKATALGDDSLILKDVSVKFYMDNGPSTRANNATQIYVYYLDDNNFYRVSINEDDYDDGYRRRVYIDKMVNGTRTELACSDRYFMLNPGTYQFKAANDTLSFKNISGGTSIDLVAIDSSLTQPGKIIFRAGEEVVYIDDVEISGFKVVENSSDQNIMFKNGLPIATPGPQVPAKFKIFQNYPNPFNLQTVIKYHLPTDIRITLGVYNILGQRVAVLENNIFKKAGVYQIIWQPVNLPAGVYLCYFKAGQFSRIMKMLLIK